jgi:hypothetical protein
MLEINIVRITTRIKDKLEINLIKAKYNTARYFAQDSVITLKNAINVLIFR